MTLWGQVIGFFPMLHCLLILLAFVYFMLHPGGVSLAGLLAITYLLPPLLFRLYTVKYAIKAGRWVLNYPARCDWWVAHQLQLVYSALPWLESLLRLFPGVYSTWLRLWGSKVGKRVYWTPRVDIMDRHLMQIGDDVIFGHLVICSGHAIHRKSDGRLILLARPIHIGKGTLIGARARIGPGVKIPEYTSIPYQAEYRFHYAQ